MLPSSVLSALVLAIAATASPLAKRSPVNVPISAASADIATSPAFSPRANAKSAVNLTSWQRGSIYSLSLAVGTPGQKVEVQFDTGSTLLWLKDKDKDEFDLPTTYRSPKSSTWKPTLDAQGKPVTIASKYGGGEIHGYIGEETVNLGGLVLEHQQFASIDNYSEEFKFTPYDGILGFAWPSSPGEGKPFWLRLADTWADKVFGMYLKRFPTDKLPTSSGSPGGSLTLGGTDNTFYNGEIHYNPRVVYPNMAGHWSVPLDGIKVNGKQTIRPGHGAIIDSGTTIIIGPTEDVAAYYAQIPGSKALPQADDSPFVMYTVPCEGKLPDVALTFGGVDYPIKQQDVNWQANMDGCIGGINAMKGLEYWVVGDTFLRNVYTAYRAEPAAVGFAPLKPEYN